MIRRLGRLHHGQFHVSVFVQFTALSFSFSLIIQAINFSKTKYTNILKYRLAYCERIQLDSQL